MALSGAQIQGLGVALNEADWLGISVHASSRQVALRLRVLTLAADGDDPVASVIVTLVLSGVTRIAASLRRGWWDGMYAGDPRTQDQGIYPAGPDLAAT